jgi:hypothetical protein
MSLALMSGGPSDIDPDAQYLDALGRANEGRYKAGGDKKFVEAARNAYERATKQDPKLVHALLGQGHMLVEQGHPEIALTPLLAAKDLDPTNSEVLYWTASAYYDLRNKGNEYKKIATQWFEAALTKGRPELALEDHADAAYRLGNLYHDETINKPREAAQNWEIAVKLAEQLEKEKGTAMPWILDLYYELGDTYYDLNNCSAQKKYWIKYRDRETKENSRRKAVDNALATSLQRC